MSSSNGGVSGVGGGFVYGLKPDISLSDDTTITLEMINIDGGRYHKTSNNYIYCSISFDSVI